jgi:hypothetical protein
LSWAEKAARLKWNWSLGFVSASSTPEAAKKMSVSPKKMFFVYYESIKGEL